MTLPYCILLLILPVVLPLAWPDFLRSLVRRRKVGLEMARRMYALSSSGILGIVWSLAFAVSYEFGQPGDCALLVAIGGAEVIYIVAANVAFVTVSSKWAPAAANDGT